MPRPLVWDQDGERLYEVGIDKVAIFLQGADGKYGKGVAWNGVSSVEENPSGAEVNKLYADNNVYATVTSNEEFGVTIQAYTYPDEFAECDGSKSAVPGVYITQQARTKFAMAYRSLIGNDTESTDYGYRIHFVYGCLASPSSRSHETINENVEPGTMSWEITTTPAQVNVLVNGKKLKNTAHIYIDSTKLDAEKLAAIEALVYGSDAADAAMPTPDELLELLTPTVNITVAAEAGSTSILGKQVSELQSGIAVGANAITGTLNYVTDYTGFSGDVSLQEGNYLALKVDSDADSVTVELVGGYGGPVTLDSDMNCVLRIESNTQSVKFVATKGGDSQTKVYALTDLVLDAAG